MLTLAELRALLVEAQKKLRDFLATLKNADGTGRRMTAEEAAKSKALIKEVEDLKGEVVDKEAADRALADTASATQSVAGAARQTLPATVRSTDNPFPSFGHFLQAIAHNAINGIAPGNDQRLKWNPGIPDGRTRAAGMNETIPSEGGFLVHTDFSTALLQAVKQQSELLNRVRFFSLSSNSNAIQFPMIDETSRQRGSRMGGIRAYWLAEGELKLDSKPRLRNLSLALNKIAALGYATDELLQDAAVMESYMKIGFENEIIFEVEDSIINGNGAGKPLGILNGGSTISVAKETSQAAATIVFQNLVKMLDRLPVRSRRNAVWLVADSLVETALYNIMLPGSAGYPIYLPPGQTNTPGNATMGLLLGRPVIPVEYLPTLGTVGDIMLVDLSEYIMIDKGGIQAAESMHVRFVYDEMTFRMVYRIDGKPAWQTPITTANGAITKSPFITLATRG